MTPVLKGYFDPPSPTNEDPESAGLPPSKRLTGKLLEVVLLLVVFSTVEPREGPRGTQLGIEERRGAVVKQDKYIEKNSDDESISFSILEGISAAMIKASHVLS